MKLQKLIENMCLIFIGGFIWLNIKGNINWTIESSYLFSAGMVITIWFGLLFEKLKKNKKKGNKKEKK